MKLRQGLFLLLITAFTCSFVWVRLQLVSIGYEIHELEEKERTLKDECNKLALKINEAKAPQRLEQLAKSKFNMYPPAANQVVVIR